jgi:hypothetical protein
VRSGQHLDGGQCYDLINICAEKIGAFDSK